MEMFNGNGSNNKLRIRMTKEEVTEYVIQKYKNLDIHPTREKMKGGFLHETEQN